MATILLTGTAGFIGYHTAIKLLKNKIKIIGIDNINDYYDTKLKLYRLRQLKKYDNFKFRKVDIEDYSKLNGIFRNNRIDKVINLAARAGVPYSKKNPFVYLNTNTMGTLNLLESMKEFGVKKIVLASTSSLYAGEKMPFKEDLHVNTPISVYAATKKSAEMLAFTYHSLYNLDVSVLRYFTVYGPAGRPDMSIFRFIKWIDEGNPIELFGDGTQSRDFTYVDDIANGTISAMKHLGYEVINLGGGNKPISIIKVIQKIEKLLSKKAKIDFRGFLDTDIKETKANINKAKKLLGWEPKYNFDKGLKITVDWYLENKKWLKNIKL